MRRLP